MDQLRALRTFVRVIDEGSFAAAARSFDAAPAVVTRLVADLEQSLGARLLHRTTRRLTLTAVGAEYAERARQILADLDEADALAASTTATLSGMLRVTGPLPFLQLQVAPLAIVSGGHVRVGFEDNVYFSKGVLAKNNAQLVARIRDLSLMLQREVANPAEARKILGIA